MADTGQSTREPGSGCELSHPWRGSSRARDIASSLRCLPRVCFPPKKMSEKFRAHTKLSCYEQYEKFWGVQMSQICAQHCFARAKFCTDTCPQPEGHHYGHDIRESMTLSSLFLHPEIFRAHVLLNELPMELMALDLTEIPKIFGRTCFTRSVVSSDGKLVSTLIVGGRNISGCLNLGLSNSMFQSQEQL